MVNLEALAVDGMKIRKWIINKFGWDDMDHWWALVSTKMKIWNLCNAGKFLSMKRGQLLTCQEGLYPWSYLVHHTYARAHPILIVPWTYFRRNSFISNVFRIFSRHINEKALKITPWKKNLDKPNTISLRRY